MKRFLLFLIGAIVGAAAVYFYCCKDSMEAVIDTPKGIITPTQAKELSSAFDSRHRLISDSIVNRPDNRSSWYSLDDMRNYLSIAQKDAANRGYNMNGIRVYIGAYPNSAGQPGYTTLFFVPTGTKNIAEGSMNLFNSAAFGGNSDIPGGNGLNMGEAGNPPAKSYPQ